MQTNKWQFALGSHQNNNILSYILKEMNPYLNSEMDCSLNLFGSTWLKLYHVDSEVGPMAFVIELDMTCYSLKLDLRRDTQK